MYADTDVINTNVNGTRISALFSISCGVYEISVSASNACGQTRSVSNVIPQTPPHSIAEPDLPTSQSTSPDNGNYRYLIWSMPYTWKLSHRGYGDLYVYS
jgi:hypothetical protein